MKTFRAKVREISLKLGIYKWVRLASLKVCGDHAQKNDLTFFRTLLHPGDRVFDVGANRGQSTEVFLRAGCEVVSFEPQNQLHNEIRQVCCGLGKFIIDGNGLGAVKEKKTLFLTDFDQTASFRSDWEGPRIGEKTVTIGTLDEKIALYGAPRYCKIDVEGWELEVLSGLSRPIPIISFEFHTHGEELLQTRAVIERISQIGNYSFNIRLPGSNKFHLPDFLPQDRFTASFNGDFWKTLPRNYGDIFCVHV